MKHTLKGQQLFRKVCMVLPICLFTSLPLTAQTFTQRLQKSAKGEATVTVHQDKAIEDLVNGTHAAVQTTTTTIAKSAAGEKAVTTPTKKTAERSAPEKKNTATKQHGGTSHQQSDTGKTDTAVVAKKSGRSYKVMGYRVQVFAGGNSRKDKQQAEQTGNQLRMLFPNEPVYVHFYSPRWICRMGNYRTYEEAHQQLREVKELGYNAATIIKGKITVQY